MQRQRIRVRKRIAGMLLWLVAAAAWPLHAEFREVAAGEALRLSDDSGLLLVAVDTDTPLQSVRIKRNGALFDVESLKGVPKGRTARLYVATAGTYRWDTVRDAGKRFRLGDDEEFYFAVKPGVLNYPGDLIYRPVDKFNATAHIANRGLLAMDWLDRTHAELSRRYPLGYVGHYADPFPAFYREKLAGRGVAAAQPAPPPVESLPLPAAVEALWKPSEIKLISLNPTGDLVAVVIGGKRGADPHWSIEMIDLRGETSTRVLESDMEISSIDWSGSRALVISCNEPTALDTLFVLQILGDGATRRYERLTVPLKGLLVDPLPGDPDHILFASVYVGQTGSGLQVHRLQISTQSALNRFRFGRTSALDRGVADDWAWFADASGRLRAAIAYREDVPVLMHGGDGKYREVMPLDDGETFSPFALSADGDLLYGWSEKGRGQRDLVELDPATGRIGRTVFSRPGIDVQGALFDGRHNLVGASYYEEGLLVSEYFDAASKTLQARLQQAFPGKTVRIIDRDADSKQFLLMVGSSDQPNDLYHFDATANRASLLRHTLPWLAGRNFASSQVVRASGKDEFPIEAYLTVPAAGDGAVPLVVLPHGGPVGVRDARRFDPEVQFLVALGYAVLQVNFRGSEGYGTRFREAGKRSFGTLIEDDIDAALAAALAAYQLDRERICAVGSSYGGYSALISAIRWPQRFRCVISISGVSDQMLFFTASDSGRSKDGRKALEETIGDPRTEAATMQAHSPLYRYRELAVPVMLAHGTEDIRVDYEHTRRLARMLGSVGRPPSLLTLEGEAHGIEDEANRRKLWEAMAAFLRRHLGPGAAIQASR